MKTKPNDPWNESGRTIENYEAIFEDSFVDCKIKAEFQKMPDSEEYLEGLQNRLKALQKGSSKRDLVSSLSTTKEDCIARLITERRFLETVEEQELSSNPMLRLIAPHLQAMTTSELVHLLKADALDLETSEQYEEKNSVETGSDSNEKNGN